MPNLSQSKLEDIGIYPVGPRPNGTLCPECGKELLDTNPNLMLMSNPPQFKVHCDGCGYISFRRA